MENVNFFITFFQRFLYDLIDVFMFPDDIVKELYDKNEIQRDFLFQNLIDTDNTSLFFIFICKLWCSINKKAARNITIEVIKLTALSKLNLSDDFCEQFNVQSKSSKK